MRYEPLTTERFIQRARGIHGDTYDYSLVDYKNFYTKIKIICNKHGVFEQIPSKHLRTRGCKKCGTEHANILKTKSTIQYINEAKQFHGDKYDYSLVNYTKGRYKVKIICKKHGVFEQVATQHLQGNNCPRCVNEERSFKMRDFYGEDKKCPTCGNYYLYTEEFFNQRKDSPCGLSCYCKECERSRNIKARKENPEKYSQYHKKAKQKCKESGKTRDYYRKKMDNDLGFRIMTGLHSNLRYALKSDGVKKTTKLSELFGCSRESLRVYIESLFTEGMTRENYGREGWWIDHIRPCASFDLTDTEQQRQCFHYTNLQPMWWKDNISKGSLFDGKRHFRRDKKKALSLHN